MDPPEAGEIRELREAYRKEAPNGVYIKSITNLKPSSEPPVLKYAGYLHTGASDFGT